MHLRTAWNAKSQACVRRTLAPPIVSRPVNRRILKPRSTVNPAAATTANDLGYFTGCNCYYLLKESLRTSWLQSSDSQAKIVDPNDPHARFVDDTLKAIKDQGFAVVRMWAFSDAREQNPPLQEMQYAVQDGRSNSKRPLKPECPEDRLKKLDWLLDRIDHYGLKAMMVLTNSLSDFGGWQRYVRWQKQMDSQGSSYADDGSHNFSDMERFEFLAFDKDQGAKKLYKDYVKTIVDRYKNKHCVHSWDICNEPRNRATDAQDGKIAEWIFDVAQFVKALDPRHPVTVGSEGWWGPAEGCNWLRESSCPDTDFACIHPYNDQWTSVPVDVAVASSNNIEWINSHIKACEEALGDKPLVIQEYNLPLRQSPQLRKGQQLASPEQLEHYYKQIRDKLKEHKDRGGVLRGAIVWDVALLPHDYNGVDEYFDQYTYLLNNRDADLRQTKGLQTLKDMNYAINTPSAPMKAPTPAPRPAPAPKRAPTMPAKT